MSSLGGALDEWMEEKETPGGCKRPLGCFDRMEEGTTTDNLNEDQEGTRNDLSGRMKTHVKVGEGRFSPPRRLPGHEAHVRARTHARVRSDLLGLRSRTRNCRVPSIPFIRHVRVDFDRRPLVQVPRIPSIAGARLAIGHTTGAGSRAGRTHSLSIATVDVGVRPGATSGSVSSPFVAACGVPPAP